MEKKNITYAKALSRIEEIVQSIERGEADVESLTAQIKEAKELLAYCNDRLTNIEKEVTSALSNE